VINWGARKGALFVCYHRDKTYFTVIIDENHRDKAIISMIQLERSSKENGGPQGPPVVGRRNRVLETRRQYVAPSPEPRSTCHHVMGAVWRVWGRALCPPLCGIYAIRTDRPGRL